MHKLKLYLFFLVTLLILPQMAYVQEFTKDNVGKLASFQPLPGKGGMWEAGVKGLIRKAELTDIKHYLIARAKIEGLPIHLITDNLSSEWSSRENTYMVLSPNFIIPHGMSDYSKFIVPQGLPKPKGPLGFVRLYSYDEPKTEQRIAETCKFPNLPEQLLANAKVFAFGTSDYNRVTKVDVQIDPSSAQSYVKQITVNSPSNPAIIILQANDATTWHFNWTKGTKTAAVYINAQYKQVVSGLPNDVPVFISDQNDPSNTCPPVKISHYLSDLVGYNNLSKHIFNKNISQLSQIKHGEKEAVAGQSLTESSQLESAGKLDLEKFRMPPNPLLGRAGLRDALAKGLIRKANKEDILQYIYARGKADGLSNYVVKNQLDDDPFYMNREYGSYVVISPDFVIPDGLYTGAATDAIFIVSEGLSKPKGPTRGVAIYSYDDLKPQVNKKKPIAETCKFSNLPSGWPPNGKVYALSNDFSTQLDFRIDGSEFRAKLMEVKINSPSEPVFLLLKANDSTIWHFSWTPGTKIAGVFVSSQQKQIISGLPKDVPLLISNLDDNPSQCPELRVSSHFDPLVADNNLSQHLFKKNIDKFYNSRTTNETGIIEIGLPLNKASPLESAATLDAKKYRAPGRLLSGKAGLREATEKGLIRVATDDDIKAYKIAEAKAKGIPENLIKSHLDFKKIENSYVVLSPDFVIPVYTYEVTFIVPEGLPEIKGLLGNNVNPLSIYSYAQLKRLSQQNRSGKEVKQINEACKFSNLPVNLPDNAKVFAVEGKSFYGLGTPLDFYIDDHNMDDYNVKFPKLMKITVNSPTDPVFLMLDGFGSMIWHFNWTKGTKIAGVYISGYGRQVTSGLLPNVPVLIDNKSLQSNEPYLCPTGTRISSYPRGLAAANNLSRHLFNKDIYQAHSLEHTKEFVVGHPLEPDSQLESAEELKPEKFRDPKVPLPGLAGLEEAVSYGLIRKAAPEEIQKYLLARAKAEGLPDHIIRGGFSTDDYAIYHNPYIVLSSDFVIPQHLYENKSASFIVPEGVQEPKRLSMPSAKAPFTMPKLKGGHYGIIEAVASRIYSYEDLTPLSLPFLSIPYPIPNYEDLKQRITYRQQITCVFSNVPDGFPANSKVYALKADSTSILDFSIEGSKKPAHLMQITINSPSESALLILKTNDPTIWHFNWTKDSKISGVFISGDGPQLVSGLPKNVPLLINDQDDDCQYPKFQISSALIDLIAVNNLSKYLFDKSIERIYSADNGKLIIGQPLSENSLLESSEDFDMSKFRDPATPMTGQEGLNDAVDKGLIRKANQEDIEEYKIAQSKAKIKVHSQNENLPEHLVAKMSYGRIKYVEMFNPYLVLSPDFIIPAGLEGTNATSFIVPVGFTEPKGPHGDCRIYSYDALEKEVRDEIRKYNDSFGHGWSPPSSWDPKFNSSCVIAEHVVTDKVYAIGASPQHELDFQIDDSGEQAHLIKLTVNAPNESVALLLDANKPLIWHLGWIKGTKISAVIISGGRYKQIISGLPEEVPILLGKGNGYDLSLCPPNFKIDYSSRETKLINGLSRHFLKKTLTKLKS